jgi:hypothetical protein
MTDKLVSRNGLPFPRRVPIENWCSQLFMKSPRARRKVGQAIDRRADYIARLFSKSIGKAEFKTKGARGNPGQEGSATSIQEAADCSSNCIISSSHSLVSALSCDRSSSARIVSRCVSAADT